MVDNAVLLIPQADHLARLQRHAIVALADAHLSADDLLEWLPGARAALMQDAYSPEFLEQLQHMREALYAETEAGAAQIDQSDGAAGTR